MAKWGSCNYDDLVKLQKNIENLIKEREEFFEEVAKELTARLLGKVIPRTPIGIYPDRVGGDLRRGWTGGKKMSAKRYAQSLKVAKRGQNYIIDIINPMEYGIFVEYGHLTRNHKSFVEGRFMLTISEQELKEEMPRIIERKITKAFGEVFK